MPTARRSFSTLVSTALLTFLTLASVNPTLAAQSHSVKRHGQPRQAACPLTLEQLKNATYDIPELSCSPTPVKLSNGQGERDGLRVVFGRAAFGVMPGTAQQPIAAVHLAYCSPEFGWLQEIAFMVSRGGKLVQMGEYALDDRETLQDLSFAGSKLQVLTSVERQGHPDSQKLTKIAVHPINSACALEISRWDIDGNGRLLARENMAGYLDAVEERVSKHWAPTSVDRGEHVGVKFTIDQSGAVSSLRVSDSSEILTADEAAVEAVEAAAPFPPLLNRSEPLDVCLEFQAAVCIRQ